SILSSTPLELNNFKTIAMFPSKIRLKLLQAIYIYWISFLTTESTITVSKYLMTLFKTGPIGQSMSSTAHAASSKVKAKKAKCYAVKMIETASTCLNCYGAATATLHSVESE